MAEQRFDEQEIGVILQRATEMQSGLTPETSKPGVTLAELQRVASEIGIEPAIVERAAQEVQTTPKVAVLTNAQTFDHTIEGEIGDETWEELVIRLREFVGRPGKSTVEGATREWRGGLETCQITFTATSRNGKTRFRLMMDTSGANGVAGVATMFMCVFLTPMTSALIWKKLDNTLLTTIIGLTIFLTGIIAPRVKLIQWRKATHQKAAELFASLVKR